MVLETIEPAFLSSIFYDKPKKLHKQEIILKGTRYSSGM